MELTLFVMAATFMRFGGIASALVNLAAAWLGGLPGSLGLVTVVACTLFAAICGSSVATALAMGTILIPAMLERGYPRSFVLGVVGASGTIGIVNSAGTQLGQIDNLSGNNNFTGNIRMSRPSISGLELDRRRHPCITA